VVIASQQISDLAKNAAVVDTIWMNTATQVFLPNAQAIKPDMREFYRARGLSDQQIYMLHKGTPKQDYYLISEDGQRMVDLVMGKVALSFVSINAVEDRMKVQDLMRRYPDTWPEEWLRVQGLPDWADDLADLKAKEERLWATA
jgi:type IV secretion system protein VirB4